MAAPTYATNLVNITTAEATTGFTAVGGGGALAAETDFFIQGSFCVSKATATTWDSAGTPIGGAMYNNGAGVTIPTDGAVLTWIYWWGPGVLQPKASGGAEISIGNLSTAYRGYYVAGSDDWAFGGWRCYPVNPSVTADRTVGSPTAVRQWFGFQVNVQATVAIGRGNPYGIDVIRYGRCDIVSTAGDINGYATFLGAADWDNAGIRRYGMLTPRDGAFFHQGLFQMGTDATAVDFRDSNRVVFIQNTEKVTANFNRYEVRNAGSRVDWTNIGISALGTVSRGRFEMVHNADVNFDACTFTDMDTFIFLSNASVVGTTFRRCNLVTPSGASFTDNLVTRSTAAIAVTTTAANLSTLQDNTFQSGGTGHALEITGSAGTYSLIGNTFTGYAASNGSTGNEAVYVNIASGSVTLNIAGGGNTPSIRTAGATVTVVAGATVTFTGLPTGCDIVILTAGTSTILDQVDQHGPTSYSYAYQGTPTVDVGFLKPGYVPYYIRNLVLGSVDSSIPVSLTPDRNYV